jgi:hypothetical protein
MSSFFQQARLAALFSAKDLASWPMRVKTDDFARRVLKQEDLPERLRPFYLEVLENGLCRSVVYAPLISNLPSRHAQPMAGYLLMSFADHLRVVIDHAAQPLEEVHVHLRDLICVEIGGVLLFSWMKLVFGSSETREIKIPFNTVRADLFVDSLNLIRNAIDLPLPEGSDLIQVTPDLDLKFTNALHSWLSSKEVLLATAFQPEVRARRFLLLERQLAPPLLAALTDRQLLMITEEPPAAFERLGQFSEIYTYCPHSKIRSARVRRNDEKDEFAELHLTMANEEARYFMSFKLSAGLAPRFDELCTLTNKLVVQHERVRNDALIN